VGEGVFVGVSASVSVSVGEGVSVGVMVSVGTGVSVEVGVGVKVAVGVWVAVKLGVAEGLFTSARMPANPGVECGACRKASTGAALTGQNAQTAAQMAIRNRARIGQRNLAKDLDERTF
jgi:hypothetical protein